METTELITTEGLDGPALQQQRKQQLSRVQRFRIWLRDDAGAVAIEYVIVAIALLAIAGAIAAALTTLGDDAVANIPGSVSEAGG